MKWNRNVAGQNLITVKWRFSENDRKQWRTAPGMGDRLILLFAVANLDIRELAAEFLDPSRGVHILQLTGIERVASVANIDLKLRLRRAGHKAVSATAGDLRVHIIRMDVLLHGDFLRSYRGHNLNGFHPPTLY